MIMKKLQIIIVIVFMSAGPAAIAQMDCFQFVRSCDDGRREGFLFNGQSKSGQFDTGDTTEVTMVAYKGMDYRITACANEQDIPGVIQLRIIERIKKPYWDEQVISESEEMPMLDEYGDEKFDDDGEPMLEVITTSKTVKKRRYKMTEQVRYDSKKDGGEFSFTSQMTRKLHIEVIVPGTIGEGGLAAEEFVSSGCVGLLIEHRKGILNGFGQ